MRTLRKMLMTFIKTSEGWNMIWLDYCGYPLVKCQSDLTLPQEIFLMKGRMKLHEEMNKVKK